MAIVELADFTDYVGSGIAANQLPVGLSLAAAEQAVNQFCRRRFVLAGTPRSVVDGVTTIDDATVTSATASFTATDVGLAISGVGIPTGTTVVSVNSVTSVEMSAVATASGTGLTVTLTGTARLFTPASSSLLYVDDIATTTDVTVTDIYVAGNTVAVASTDFQLEPLNGLDEAGNRVPYTHIWRVGGWWYPFRNQATVSVAAPWGWVSIPVDVVEACRILAKDLVSLRDTRFGVAGFGEFGVVRMRENPQVVALLAPYVRHRQMVA